MLLDLSGVYTLLDRDNEYVFFIDLEGHIRDDNIAQAFAGLEAEASLVKLLGSYPRAVP